MVSIVNGLTRSGDEPVEELVAEVRAGRAGRWAALAALAKSSDPRAYDALAEFATAADWTVRRAAVEALGQHAEGRRAEALLRLRLGDASPHVVRSACQAVCTLGLATLRPEVLSLLDADEAATRRVALGGVEALWVPEDAAPVLTVFDRDPDLEVRHTAAFVLRRRAAPGWWPTLVTRWRDDPLPRHRVWACELAVASGIAELRERVAVLVDDRDGHVRRAARAVIGYVDRAP